MRGCVSCDGSGRRWRRCSPWACSAAAADSDDGAPPTTVTTEPAPTTTIEQGDAKGIACLNVATAGLAVRNDFNQASRGVAGPPDPEPYRERAAVLRAEHERLGCPGELLDGFLE